MLNCAQNPIIDKPISFSAWRTAETVKYVQNRYGRNIDSIEMLPLMAVIHYTESDDLEQTFRYLNTEFAEPDRKGLAHAGNNNIAVPFLVDRDGEIYKLMPENHIGRHVIGLNRHAVGIENVAMNESALTQAQIDANIYLLRYMAAKYPLRYLIAHSEYRKFENTPLWEEKDSAYRSVKIDPGETFMRPLRMAVADLKLSAEYDYSEVPVRIGHVLAEYHEKGQFNGVALVILNGQIVFRKPFGQRGDTLSPPLRASDTIYLASAAKSMTATLMHILISRNLLNADTLVAPYFPELQHLLRGVTVQHLLSHTSGLEDYYQLTKVTPGFTNQNAMSALAQQKKPLSVPGQQFHYANSNYILLAQLASEVTGKDFAALMHEEIFSKAAMASASFLLGARPEKRQKFIGSLKADKTKFSYEFLTVGAGGLYINADDLAAFDSALWNNTFFAAKLAQKMYQPVIDVKQKKTSYAAGWYAYPKSGVVYHDGNFGGYHSMNWLQPHKKNAIILLSNRDTKAIKEITWRIDRILNGQMATKLH